MLYVCPPSASLQNLCNPLLLDNPHTASHKRKPKLNRTWMAAHPDAITPQIGDPREAFPRLLTTLEHWTACLDLLQPLTCMTPSLLRDHPPWLSSCSEALDMHAISATSATCAGRDNARFKPSALNSQKCRFSVETLPFDFESLQALIWNNN